MKSKVNEKEKMKIKDEPRRNILAWKIQKKIWKGCEKEGKQIKRKIK